MKKYDVIIVGAGPAGLVAAGQLVGTGLQTVVIDNNRQPGGQLVKQIHKFFGAAEVCAGIRGIRLAERLYKDAYSKGCQFLMDATVYSISEEESGYQILADIGTDTVRLYGKAVLLATGASENTIAFPGWTMPGVITAGAAQTMVNLSGVRIGKKVLMVGAGNVGLIVSYQLLQAGMEVVAIIEAAPHVGGYTVHANKLRRAGIPIYLSHTLIEARGEESVEQAVIAQVDDQFEPVPGTQRILEVDTICLAVGLSPLVKLAASAGCKIIKNKDNGETIPQHDDALMTSRSGIFIAGDVSGVEEASIAMEEGIIASGAIQAYLGYRVDRQKQTDCLERLASLRKRNLIRGNLQEDRSQSYQPYKGLRAVIECYDQIPCNPCQFTCPTGAIYVGPAITDTPRLTLDKCIGCGKCVAACPGLACFLIDVNYSAEEAEIAIPYEYFPIPEKGCKVMALSREGHPLCEARISRVVIQPTADHTAIVYFTVPKEYAWLARGISSLQPEKGGIV